MSRARLSGLSAALAVLVLLTACSSGSPLTDDPRGGTGSSGRAQTDGGGSGGGVTDNSVRVLGSGIRQDLAIDGSEVIEWAQLRNENDHSVAVEVTWTVDGTTDRTALVPVRVPPHVTTYVVDGSTLTDASGHRARATATPVSENMTSPSLVKAGPAKYEAVSIDTAGGPGVTVALRNVGDMGYTLDTGVALVCQDRGGRVIGIGQDVEDPTGAGELQPGESVTQHITLNPSVLGSATPTRCTVYTEGGNR